MRKLKIDITIENVIKYAGNSDQMKDDFVLRGVESSGLDNDYLLQIARKEETKKFDDLFFENPYDDIESQYSQYLKIDKKGVVSADGEAIEEAATVYVQPNEMDAYERHQTAVAAINAFFKGKIPHDIRDYFITVNEKIEAGKSRVVYSPFV